ncbi:DUF3552 domain-containing protein, partial [Myxococcota bacterium]|nr:DUF3552 domain-containing protein [Myxococcota bacterium]
MSLLISIGVLIIGVGVGVALAILYRRNSLRDVSEDSQKQHQSTLDQVSTIIESGLADAKKVATQKEKERKQRSILEEKELDDFAAELDNRESVLDDREKDHEELNKEVEDRGEEYDELKQKRKELDKTLRNGREIRLEKMEEVAGTSRTELIENNTAELISKAELQSKILIRTTEEQANESASREANRLLAAVIDRYSGVSHLERVQNTHNLTDERIFTALSKEESEARETFEKETGCELVCDEEKQNVTVRSDDPLAREMGRRVLKHIVTRLTASPDRIRAFCRQTRNEIDREVQNAARQTLKEQQVGKVHPDILNLIGRLKFRLSYSQNQLKHATEVSSLTGLLAAELGLDTKQAKRGGLLHDIGKAMTHDNEGSHAVLGAQVARRCEEDEIISNAIGSHHNDEPANSPLAHLVAAADAISGARPGARRENVTSYISRMQ